VAAIAALTLIIGAAYTLWMVKRVIFGAVTNEQVKALKDIGAREALVLGAFAVGTLFFGIYPKPLTDLMDTSIAQLAAQLAASKL
jgi:NADH-quinone oxidoreductase subunit M